MNEDEIKKINLAREANIAAKADPYSGAGATATNYAITPESLRTSSPYLIPETPYSTTASRVSGLASGVLENTKANALNTEITNKLKETESAKDQSKKDMEDVMNRIIGVQASVPNIQEEYKVAEKTQKYNDITSQLENSQRAQKKELDDLAGSGLTDVQRNAKGREINRAYASEQADLALIQSAANRDMLTASSLAKTKVDLLLEPLKTKLDFVKTFYEDNKDSFNKADSNSFQVKIKEMEQEYQTKEKEQENLQKTKLELLKYATENNAPSEILMSIQNSKTADEAVIGAGQWGKKGKSVSNKKLETTDIQRIKDLYDITLPYGTTEAEAEKILSNKNTPEVQTRDLITSAKDNGNDYETVINEIENDPSIIDKELAKKIAREVYGINEETELQKIINQKASIEKVNPNNRPANEFEKNGFWGGLYNTMFSSNK